jgi:hypothetical protein
MSLQCGLGHFMSATKYKLEESEQVERKRREMEELIQRQLEEEHDEES